MDKVDIKNMKLEDEPIIFANYDSKKRNGKILSLKNVGITTVDELANADQEKLPLNHRRRYNAIKHVFRHEYKGEPFIFDVILEKEYFCNYPGYKECVSDLMTLGLVSFYSKDCARRVSELFEGDNSKTTFTIGEILPRLDFGGQLDNSLQRYYVNYLKKNKEIDYTKGEKKPLTPSEEISELSSLKIQYQTLYYIDQGLQNQMKII